MTSKELSQNIKIKQRQLDDLKHGIGSSSVLKQIKIDKQMKKERFDKECREKDGVYRVKCVDVVNYKENCKVEVHRMTNSLSDKFLLLRTKVHLYSNLGQIDVCMVFTKRYKDKHLENKMNEKNENFWKKFTDELEVSS